MEGEPADVVELHRVHTEEARARPAAAARRPASTRGSSRSARRVRPRAADGGQRRRRMPTSRPTTPPKARAPRQSSERRDLAVDLPRDDDAGDARRWKVTLPAARLQTAP